MKRLAATLAALFLGCTVALAEPPACKGTDLLADLLGRDPKAHKEVMEQAAAVKNGEAIFWKIEKDGVEPSYLLGTAHVTDPRVTRMPPEAQSALKTASVVALELKEIRNPQELALASMRLARLMVLPQGKTLWDLLPDPEEAAVRGNANMPPGAEKTIFGYQPWVVAAMLSVPRCESARKQAGLASLDEIIAKQAEEQGSTLVGLETVEEQLSVFAAMPLDLQTKYLVSVAKAGPRVTDYFETLINLYLHRLITAYVPLSLKLEPTDGQAEALMAFVERDLTIKRNHVMEGRAKDLLAKGDAFIAVGAMHLPGDEGLVELIRQAGYKVIPIN
jgi:uncharacterized protein YbaP (TraB family)